MSTPFAHTIDDLIIGQHSTQGLTPVHFPDTTKSKAVLHQDFSLSFFRKSLPLSGREGKVFFARTRMGGIALHFKDGHQFTDSSCFLQPAVHPAVKQLQKYPLGPFVISFVRSTHFTFPIITEADLVQLRPKGGDVLIGGNRRRNPVFNGVLLGGKTK